MCGVRRALGRSPTAKCQESPSTDGKPGAAAAPFAMAAKPPRPLLRTQREVDALYDCLQLIQTQLQTLGIPFLLIAGSLLGSLRSRSFLFSDDDIDLAVFEADYPRVLSLLPSALQPHAIFTRRPFPAADRVRPRCCTQVWVDLFVLRRYDSLDAVRAVVERKDNGALQPEAATAALLREVAECAPVAGQRWPLWHYDTRLALQLWPREFLTGAELFPLRPRPFGHLTVPSPARAAAHLLRAYGPRCFQEWVLAVQHGAFHRETAARLAALGIAASGEGLGPPRALEDAQLAPITHSRHRAPPTPPAALRAALEAELAEEAQWGGAPGQDPQLWPPASAAAGGEEGGAAPPCTRLGVALALATRSAPTPLRFTPELLGVLEPHVAKARAARAAGRSYGAAQLLPAALALESCGAYDARAHPLAAALAAALGLQAGGEESLFSLHAQVQGAGGKHACTARLRDAGVRSGFVSAFDRFVRAAALPHLARLVGRNGGAPRAARVQAFPSLRFICPGEFSLGVHCDTFYSHSPHSVNIVVPLTPRGRAGPAGLYCESQPGKEDWHAIGDDGEGSFATFHGGQCLHFTGENPLVGTGTRVSLDFRVLWGEGECGGTDRYQEGGFYCRWVEGAGGEWERVEPLPHPDFRVGYPFVGVKAMAGEPPLGAL